MAAAVKPPIFLLGTAQLYMSDTGAPPSAAGDGNFVVGDIILNSVPTAGGTFCWVCTTAGPGGTAVFKTVAIGA